MSLAPILVQSDVPVPAGKLAVVGRIPELRSVLQGMKPGDSFLFDDNKAPFAAAKQIHVKVMTRKVSGSGYRIWRIE